jgi:hypothetical protein
LQVAVACKTHNEERQVDYPVENIAVSAGSSAPKTPTTAREKLPKAEVVVETLFLFEKNSRWGYRTKAGDQVIAPVFLMATDFSKEGMAAVVDEQGWAWIDQKGEVIARPFVFDNGPDYFREGLA